MAINAGTAIVADMGAVGVYGSNTDTINEEIMQTIITNISPTENPFQTMTKTRSISKTTFDWLEDSLEEASNNAQLEGNVFTPSTQAKPKRLTNICQILSKSNETSNTVLASDTIARQNQAVYDMMKKTDELKNDNEFGLLSRKAAVGGARATARQYAGFPAFLRSFDYRGASGTSPTLSKANTSEGYPNAVGTAGGARALSFDLLSQAVTESSDAGGMLDYAIVPFKIKSGISKYIYGKNDQSGARVAHQGQIQSNARKKLGMQAAVDTFYFDFRQLDLVPNRFSPKGATASEIILVTPKHICIPYLRPLKHIDQPNNGDASRDLIVQENSLEVKAENAQAVVADINDTLDVVA